MKDSVLSLKEKTTHFMTDLLILFLTISVNDY